MSVPAETEFAAMLVPSCARAKAVAMKKTPTLLEEVPSSRKACKRSSGFQIASPPKMTVDDEETIMPMKDVTPKPMGMVNS